MLCAKRNVYYRIEFTMALCSLVWTNCQKIYGLCRRTATKYTEKTFMMRVAVDEKSQTVVSVQKFTTALNKYFWRKFAVYLQTTRRKFCISVTVNNRL